MKGMDIFCASQAATSICLSMEQQLQSPSSTIDLLGSQSPAIDRYNPIIRDSSRITKHPGPPPSINNNNNNIPPKPHKKHNKNKKKPLKNDENNSNNNVVSSVRKRWSCTKPGEFISPHGSTRFLLSDNKVFLNAPPPPDLGPAPKASSSEPMEIDESRDDDKPKPSSHSPDQVVVLRVSLHCRGCERKMRKHISRMQGVTSFNIDFVAKKVTITGNVTPLEVLSSISKVKNAQLWSQSVSSSTPPTLANLNDSELNKEELVLKF